MTNKYYYTAPLKVLWMIENFGVEAWIYPTTVQMQEFGSKEPWDWMSTCDTYGTPDINMVGDAVKYIKDVSGENAKIYVTHKDPDFFEPKPNDIGLCVNRKHYVYPVSQWVDGDINMPDGPVNIINRNNKHFFMPEIEEGK